MPSRLRNILSRSRPVLREDPERGVAVPAEDRDSLEDPILAALAQELGGLGDVHVPGAARERTRALLREEMEARPAAVPSWWRAPRLIAAGSLAVVAAGALALTLVFTGGQDPDRLAGQPGTSTPTVSGPAPTEPVDTTTDRPGATGPSTSTSIGAGSTTSSSVGSGSTVAPGTTVGPGTTQPAPSTTVPAGGARTTSPPSPKPSSTTEPAPTTTDSGAEIMTWGQREKSARTVALAVAMKATSGDLSGASVHLSGTAAGTGLRIMAASLEDPGSAKVSVEARTSAGARVLVVIADRVDDGQGGTTEVTKRFYMDVRVDDVGDAVVTAIMRAP